MADSDGEEKNEARSFLLRNRLANPLAGAFTLRDPQFTTA
jgi:hypothetical protein